MNAVKPKPDPKFMKQVGNTCGQTCIAMLSNKPLADAMGACHKLAETDGADLVRGLRAFKLKCSPTTQVVTNDTPLPEVAILRFKTPRNRSGKPSWGGHWVLKFKDQIFDPAMDAPVSFEEWNKLNELMASVGAKISGYIEVEWTP